MQDQTLRCTSCNETKPICAFSKSRISVGRHGLAYTCKACDTARAQASRPKCANCSTPTSGRHGLCRSCILLRVGGTIEGHGWHMKPLIDAGAIADPDLSWLIGLFEGEGTFAKGLSLEMTDRDVIAKAALLMGREGDFTEHAPRKAHWSTSYKFLVSDNLSKRSLVSAMYPHLGQRRQQQCRTHRLVAAAPGPDSCTREFDSTLWLAGLLEGEGTFLHGPPSEPNRPVLRVEMTDEDVVRRAAALLNTPVYGHAPRKEGYKPTFSATLRGAKAVEMMKLLQPLMGTRRQAAIAEVLERYNPHRPRKVTDEQVREIVRLRDSGMRAVTIAEMYGIDKSYVYKIQRVRPEAVQC